MGLFKAILDAIHGSDEKIAGQAITRLLAPISETEVTTMEVESTIGFGVNTDGTFDAKLLIGGEVIFATARTNGPTTFTFDTLTRGVDNTKIKLHPVNTLVYDLSRNSSALDHLRRGFFVDTALGEDLDTVGRNLGVEKCPGLSEEQWRAIIKATAYLPKQTIDAFDQALTALLGAGNFDILERPITDPWTVFVQIIVALSTSVRGRFLLNGGEPQLTTGLNTVAVDYDVVSPPLVAYPGAYPLSIPPNTVVRGNRTFTYPPSGPGTAILGVFLDTPSARRGNRSGMTNYFLPGGTVLANVITLGTSPGAAGTAVLVDYTAFSAHYLAQDEGIRDDGDRWAYLSDPLLTARCLLDHIRAAGIRVDLSVKL